VTDVNDHSPVIDIDALSPVEGHAATPEAAAAGSFVAHVIATDADAGANGRVSCQLDGPDSNLFHLSAVQVAIIIVIIIIIIIIKILTRASLNQCSGAPHDTN